MESILTNHSGGLLARQVSLVVIRFSKMEFEMRVDLEFFGSLLSVFVESKNAHIDFNDISNAVVETEVNGEISEKLAFHLQLALDNQLIGKRSGAAYTLKWQIMANFQH